MGTSSKAAERKVIVELTGLLKKNSDKVLSGETNLCLTTSSLSIIAVNLRRFSENAVDAETSRSYDQKSNKKEEIDLKTWKENIRTLLDFVLKVKALKIIHGSYTMKAPIQVSRFRSLQVLEVKKVPIHMVEGLSKLRGQLQEITVSKSLQTLKDLLEICGGDRTPGLVWQHLKTAYLSFNTLQELDQSLNFIPYVEVIDLSHNSITNTEDCLQNLLELMRINLGYNLLKSVPQFSSAKFKLKTLVLRSNSLENLEGVEELCALEELDVSENFLLDHSVLQGLYALKRLQVLCLLGNPLSYKSHHRSLTLQYIHPQTGFGVFLLDGKKLSHHETMVLQKNRYRNIYDQETATSSSGNGTLGVDDADSNISVSHLSPHVGKKKRGHRRMHSKERIPKIANIEDSLKEENMPKSQGVSPSTSCADESEIEEQKERDEKYFETLREHHRDDWLRFLPASQSDLSGSTDRETFEEQSPASRQNDKRESSKENGISKKTGVRTERQDQSRAQEKEDPPVVEEEIHPQVFSPVTSPTSEGTKGEDSPFIKSTSPERVKNGETTDIYSLPKSDKEKGHRHSQRVFHLFSDDTQDGPISPPLSPQEVKTGQYGAESDPYIMMLPDDGMKPLIVTTNQRFITEKDLSGNKITDLDLKYLKRMEKTEEKCYGKDLIGGFVFTILRLDFDYVRKDMRQRRYAVESNVEAVRFESQVSGYIKSKEVEVHTMQCMKCDYKFDMTSADQSADQVKCPKCSSKMVIPSEKVKVTLRAESKSEQKPGEDFKGSKRRSWHRSSMRRSGQNQGEITPSGQQDDEAGEDTHVDDTDSSKVNIDKPDTADRYSLGSSLKAVVDQLIPPVLPDTSDEGNTQGPSEASDQRVGQTVEPSGLKSNSSWSDVRKSAAGRDSASSVESDITVLATNSSRGSVAAISESSQEVLMASATNVVQNTLTSADTTGESDGVILRRNHTSDTDITWAKDKQGHVTPVGSPLSNSVCSSMVSSVYENTLAGSGEDATSREESTKFNDTSRNQDDILVESVPVRRSKSDKLKTRKSKNRNVTVYDEDFNLAESDSKISVIVEDTSKKSSSRESSIYDSSVTSDNTKFEDSLESSVPSIYDTAVSGDNLESSHDDSVDLHSHSSRQSYQSSTNQNGSGHSSPLRRKGSSRSRSRSNSRNRSAMYHDGSVHEPEDKNNSAKIPEFPSELSPIKRTSSSRHSVKNRSALFIDNSSEISDLGQSLDVSAMSAESSNVTEEVSVQSQESAQLPWEQSENQSADTRRKDESLNHDEFVKIDHNIKLHLELQVFKADETAQCAIQCDVVQYMKKEVEKSLLVISTHRIIIFRIQGDSPGAPDWLKSYEDQPITELRYIDIGLGYQTLRLEFETECSSYTLLIADEGRCKKFLTLISDIVAHSDHSHLERIVKLNPTSKENLEQQVLTTEDDINPQEMARFLMVKYSHTETNTDEVKMQSLVVTKTDLVLIDENHQWPLPRLQAPLTADLKGRQFTVVQREKINNIGTLSFNENKPTELQLTFLETSAVDSPSTWFINFETMKGVKSFVDAIREPWEVEFGVSLDITSVSFTDTDTSSVMA